MKFKNLICERLTKANVIKGVNAYFLPNVRIIEEKSFYKNKDIMVVVAPKLKEVDFHAFSCSSIMFVVARNLVLVKKAAFSYCHNLKYVSVENVINFEEESFYNCTKLTSILNNSCKRLVSNAFYGCCKLQHIEFSSLEQMDQKMFYFSPLISFKSQLQVPLFTPLLIDKPDIPSMKIEDLMLLLPSTCYQTN